VDALKVLTFMNIKGGVGKTTLAYATACLFKRIVEIDNPKILAVDIDQQANLTRVLINSEEKELAEEVNINAIFSNEFDPEKTADEIVYSSKISYIDLIPSSILLGVNEYQNQLAIDSYNRLKKLINVIGDNYDLVIIDTPPNINIYTVNALLASNYVVIPIAPNFLSTQGIRILMDNIVQVKKYNPDLKPLGLIINQADRRYRSHKIFVQYLYKVSKYKIYEPIIGMSSVIQKLVMDPSLFSSKDAYSSRGFGTCIML